MIERAQLVSIQTGEITTMLVEKGIEHDGTPRERAFLENQLTKLGLPDRRARGLYVGVRSHNMAAGPKLFGSLARQPAPEIERRATELRAKIEGLETQLEDARQDLFKLYAKIDPTF